MPEIYGTTFIEDARDKIIVELNALKTTMATGYSPTFSYVYDRHNVAKLQLNAVSVDLESAEPSLVGTNDYFIRWLMLFTIRVHTAYADGIQDGLKNARLLNSIINKLKGNKVLGGGFRIQDVREVFGRLDFAESDTMGGQLMCVVEITVEHLEE